MGARFRQNLFGDGVGGVGDLRTFSPKIPQSRLKKFAALQDRQLCACCKTGNIEWNGIMKDKSRFLSTA
jgi:hypothetical protein